MPTPGLTVGRVNGEKTLSGTRKDSLTDLRRWPGDGFSGNPVLTPGLTAGRVNGEKKHYVSDAARTASLTDLRRWPGDGFFGLKPNSGSDALPIASLPEDFSGKIGS